MGTRGLTAVFFDGEYRVAQYGQWDHYPSGQGITALEFCRKWLQREDPVKTSQFVSNLMACHWVTEEEFDAAKKSAGIGADGWMTLEQGEKFHKVLSYVNRDHGADILNLIADSGPGAIQNSIDFAGVSLFCEYAYVIDMDKGTFEVYKGFNHTPLDLSERFAKAKTDDPPKDDKGKEYHQKYEPVKLWKQWKLDDLPSNSAFLKALHEGDEEDEDGEETEEAAE